MTATEQRPLHPQSNLIAHAGGLLLGSVWDKETIRPLESDFVKNSLSRQAGLLRKLPPRNALIAANSAG
jgi:hypothetical protein